MKLNVIFVKDNETVSFYGGPCFPSYHKKNTVMFNVKIKNRYSLEVLFKGRV